MLKVKARNKMKVLPREARGLVNVLKRAIRARKVEWNYLVVWKDAKGIGIDLGIVDWLQNDQVWIDD